MKKIIKYFTLCVFSIFALILCINYKSVITFAEEANKQFYEIEKGNVIESGATYEYIQNPSLLIYKDKDGNIIYSNYLNYGYNRYDTYKMGDTCENMLDYQDEYAIQYLGCTELYKSEEKDLKDVKKWYVEDAVGNIRTNLSDYGYTSVTYTYIDGKPYYNAAYSHNNENETRYPNYMLSDYEGLTLVLLYQDFEKFMKEKFPEEELPETTTEKEKYQIVFEYLYFNHYGEEFIEYYGEDNYNKVLDKVKVIAYGDAAEDEFKKMISENKELFNAYTDYEDGYEEEYEIFNYIDNNYGINDVYSYDYDTIVYILTEYSEPTFNLNCSSTTLSKGETTTCTVHLESQIPISQINANLKTEHLKIVKTEGLNEWNVTENNNSLELIQETSNRTNADIIEITLEATGDVDVETAITLTDIQYTDTSGINDYDDLTFPIKLIQNPDTSDIFIIASITIVIGTLIRYLNIKKIKELS